METKHKNAATILHLSTLSQYFIPFGNFILPIIIWASLKKDSAFVESHGRKVINFQLSIFLYTIILFLIAIPVFLYSIFSSLHTKAIVIDEDFFFNNLVSANWTGVSILVFLAAMMFFLMKVAEFFLVIFAGVKASNGEECNYPATINFIRARTTIEPAVFETATE